MNKEGFGLISVLIAVGVLAVLVGGGYYYYSNLDNAEIIEENTNVEGVLNGEIKAEEAREPFLNISEANFSLSKCQSLDNYKKFSWYKNLSDRISDLNVLEVEEAKDLYLKNSSRYNSYQDLIVEFGKVDVEDVSTICESDNYIIVVIGGVYMGYQHKLLRYDVYNDVLEFVVREDVNGGKNTPWYLVTNESYLKNAPEQAKEIYLWSTPPRNVVGVSEGLMKMEGKISDGGCRGTSYYNYNLEDNYVRIKRNCSFCEGEKKETCIEY
ncbi:TPA: hypothetical protein DCZ46_00750 [Candidatus Campbellbacteria bacterium]|nr:MAG: seg [Candidatus Campbellbacteria bacterium GW2011_OD1_34_28]KKP75386.1 MAG: hypothetical protein UR74_C0001G0242 [Candidatus Campbellbacteria bacterium GW2011_GWD2_35_24]KKP76053.1 MAG: hypothetical protein UR75_C0001G0087 [Candidatus Campbellbacteria bacterium GW2011_GWC2_35_28]KKP77242.1 MAG: hypothetical protein UR76_C0001G0087 [Candidatus Campbellbacteria bacterium GW2011_GWC1_35_31]KKP79171.1 MAG: hypothetical protein UR79_C0001G0087 [Candidatus Campbellbacteria bacterium GW2011_GW